jgi:hypothetical protein
MRILVVHLISNEFQGLRSCGVGFEFKLGNRNSMIFLREGIFRIDVTLLEIAHVFKDFRIIDCNTL